MLLSGLSKDGVEGLRAIKEAGGKALVQSPSEAMFDTPPRNALTYDGPSTWWRRYETSLQRSAD